jgi:hypothetical protein
MHRTRSLIIALLIALLTFAAAAPCEASYSGKRDNKSVAELDLMSDFELSSEASTVCIDTAGGAANLGDAVDYLQTISRIARKHHGGMTQTWVTGYLTAIGSRDTNQCLAALQAFLDTWKKQQSHKQQKMTP